MSGIIFDHDRLDVYRLAVQDTAESFGVAKTLFARRTRMAMKLDGVAEAAADY